MGFGFIADFDSEDNARSRFNMEDLLSVLRSREITAEQITALKRDKVIISSHLCVIYHIASPG